MDALEVIQNHFDELDTARLVLAGEWKLDYFNIRDGVTDIVLTKKVGLATELTNGRAQTRIGKRLRESRTRPSHTSRLAGMGIAARYRYAASAYSETMAPMTTMPTATGRNRGSGLTSGTELAHPSAA